MNPLLASPIDSSTALQVKVELLAARALAKLSDALRGYGNQISPMHETALRDLLASLAAQALGLNTGRIAYGLPCGGGKTQSVVALISAAFELGLPLTFAVSAAQILSLARIKRDLVIGGVRAEKIGLRHSKTDSDVAALVMQATQDAPGEGSLAPYAVDTGEVEFPIMLVCHARIRGAKELPAFCEFGGKARDLLIWDETLMTTDAEALSLLEVNTSIDLLLGKLGASSALADALKLVRSQLSREVASQYTGAAPSICLLLPNADLQAIASELRQVSAFGRFGQPAIDTVKALLRLAPFPLSIAITGHGKSGDGVIHYTVSVDPDLRNIAILDASYPIRLLSHQTSIADGTTEAMRRCKRYERVKVTEYKHAAGKMTLMSDRSRVQALAVRVALLLRAIPHADSVLIFTHKGDDKRSLQASMQSALSAEGIDLSAVVNDQKRINWLTWGSETSLSTMKHCTHVILCGVTRRNTLELAASMAGQKGDLCHRMTYGELSVLLVSEMAHCVLQAMNRGSARTIDGNGMAGAMELHMFVNVEGLRDTLALSLPGIEWEIVTTDSMTEKAKALAKEVLAYLTALPRSVVQISVQRLKTGFGKEVGKEMMTKAVNEAVLLSALVFLKGGQRWQRSPSHRSLVRVAD